MRRLAIIDPSGGQQPIFNEDGDICAVVNGEIYNYRELRARLERRGHVFRSDTDVECVVHAYEEHGTACFSELRGMFAVAIWDARTQSLVLGRDRFGKKPLFYTINARGLFFASELKSLLAVPDIGSRLNRPALHDYLMLGYVPTPDCMIDGIRKLPPAHCLVFRNGHASLDCYWSLRYAPKLEEDEAALTDRLEAAVEDAVVVRLNSDVPFGAFLSGGVDSSLVVAMMAKNMRRPVQTFSIGFEDAAFNEAADARRVAEHLGTEHHELVVTPDAAGLLHDLSWYLDEPLADSSAIPTFLVAQLARRHVKMVLTGDGGDEMFAGYERYARYLQLRAMKNYGLQRLLPLARHVVQRLPGRAGRRLQWVAKRLGMQHPDDYLSGVALATPAAVRQLLDTQSGAPRDFGAVSRCFLPGSEPLGALDTILDGDVRSYMLDDILVKVDRTSMANSLEARSPLLDHRLAELAARLPEHYKMKGATGKYLLKKVALRHLPERCVHKRKQGFAIPLGRWLREDLRELMMDTIHGDSFRNRNVFNVQAVRRIAGEHVRGTGNHAEILWAILVFEFWAQRFLTSSETVIADSIQELRLASG
ncbi:MAG TPA: asparagine synthase (glutamine-hydrolyzing), partial [Gammaproteobacteria bacterium]